MDQHHFDTLHAKQYGLLEAILINNFQHWIKLNRDNNRNFRDGKTWTYNSVKSFHKQYFYVSRDKVRRALDNLEEKGVIVKGVYNERPGDRTTWYAFADEDFWVPDPEKEADHLAPVPSGRGNSAKSPIGTGAKSTYTTDNNADDNADKAAPSAPVESASTEVALVVPKILPPVEQVFAHWQAVMQMPRAKLDAKRRAAVQARLDDDYTAADLMQAIEGCRKSEWHMGKNDDHKVFNDLELICRDASKVDRFMAHAQQAVAPASGDDDWKGYLQRRQQRQAGNDPFTIDMEEA